MTPGKLFFLLFGTIAAGILLGALVGLLLGALSPNLIQLFVGRDFVGEPVKTGIALGLLNGGIYGFFGGIVLVIGAVVIAKKNAD